MPISGVLRTHQPPLPLSWGFSAQSFNIVSARFCLRVKRVLQEEQGFLARLAPPGTSVSVTGTVEEERPELSSWWCEVPSSLGVLLGIWSQTAQ